MGNNEEPKDPKLYNGSLRPVDARRSIPAVGAVAPLRSRLTLSENREHQGLSAVCCEPFSASNSLIIRENTGNFAILAPERGRRTPKSAGSTRAFSVNSLRNGTGNFKSRTGNFFGRSGNFQDGAGKLSSRALAIISIPHPSQIL